MHNKRARAIADRETAGKIDAFVAALAGNANMETVQAVSAAVIEVMAKHTVGIPDMAMISANILGSVLAQRPMVNPEIYLAAVAELAMDVREGHLAALPAGTGMEQANVQ